jgi:hypothetical protein
MNLGDQLQLVALLPAAVVTASGNGTGKDLQQLDGEIGVILDSAGGTGNADNRLNVKLQESDDNSTFSDITGGAFTQVAVTASQQKISLNKNELKRYVRAVKTVAGTTPSFVVSVSIVGINKYPA